MALASSATTSQNSPSYQHAPTSLLPSTTAAYRWPMTTTNRPTASASSPATHKSYTACSPSPRSGSGRPRLRLTLLTVARTERTLKQPAISGQSPRNRRLLLIPLTLYFGLALMYAVTIPAGASPDEPGHLPCVEQVSRLQRIPQIDPPSSGEWWSPETVLSGRMCYHMPLYYLMAGGTQQIVHRLTNAPLHYQFPATNPQWGISPA